MESPLRYKRKWEQSLHFVLILLGVGMNGIFVLANSNNEYYSIVEEHQTCEHIIPKFIEQVMNHQTSNCDEQGLFPKPGNCSVFFKCVQSDSQIQPFIEYCAVGYNFVNSVCIPNTNSSDCPQYTCRIPDATGESGNEVEINDESSGIQSLPLVVTTSTAASSENVESESSTSASATTMAMEKTTYNSSSSGHENEIDPAEHFMQMTQTEGYSSGTLVMISKYILVFHAITSLLLN